MFKTATTKGEETRRRIYDAALVLFRERGFETATMRDVASAAGMSLGAAYHYFPSKDAIVLAYYDEVTAEHERRVLAELGKTKGLRERLRVPFHTKLDILEGDRPLMGALLRFAGQPGHPLSFLGPTTRPMQLRNMAIFGESLRGASLPDDTRVLAPVALWAMHMGLLLYFIYDDSPGQRRTRRLADAGVELFVAALRMAKLPLMRGMRRKLLETLRDARLVPDLEQVEGIAPATNDQEEKSA
ncbi:MAG TPA: TetR/AcrR family transcriptional regulator [Gemmatimonadaceae bacterium]|nr:TetR/AcrR family transcriptional regulator [Gemmatimonadaceae bacterium]